MNDGGRRQLVVLDSQLKLSRVVFDSAASDGRSYGPKPAPLISYAGDSMLFVDGQARALLVLNSVGEIVRVMAPVRPGDLGSLSYLSSGSDREGRLIYQADDKKRADPTRSDVTLMPDSAAIVRADFDTRRIDTLARAKLRRSPVRAESRQVGDRMEHTMFINPLPSFDEWVVTEDGSVAIIRGQDYHVDFVRPDGSTDSGSKLPFAWKSLTAEDKEALVDSSRQVRLAKETAASARAPVRVSAAAAAKGKPAALNYTPPITLERGVEFNEIPDYWPPVRQGSIRADREGNVWILPTTSTASGQGELVYDVVHRRGNLLRRVRIPPGKAAAGFGRNGTIYLMQRFDDAGRGWTLERAREVATARTAR